MSHIHIPDGVLPWWLWVPGWLLALALVYVAGRAAERHEVRRKVPLLAVVSALMLVAMSSEVIPIAYHINLTVVAGVLLGPALSVIAAFIVQVVLAMLGHGGVTVLGLNTLVVTAEMVVGWALFRALTAMLSRRRVRWAAGIATVLTLAVSTTMLVGIVALAGGGAAAARDTGALDPASMSFANPFTGAVFRVGLFSGGEHGGGAGAGGSATGPAATAEPAPPANSVARFAVIVYTLGSVGWVLEALVTAWILGYLARVRPGLVWDGAMQTHDRRIPGDEAVH